MVVVRLRIYDLRLEASLWAFEFEAKLVPKYGTAVKLCTVILASCRVPTSTEVRTCTIWDWRLSLHPTVSNRMYYILAHQCDIRRIGMPTGMAGCTLVEAAQLTVSVNNRATVGRKLGSAGMIMASRMDTMHHFKQRH